MNGMHKKVRTSGRNRFAVLAALASTGTLLVVALATPADASTSGPVMSGRAYGVGLSNTRVLGVPVADSASPDTGVVSSATSTDTTAGCTNLPAGLVTATLLCSSVSIDGGRYNSYAEESVASAHIGIPGLPVIDALGLEADSFTGCRTGLDGTVGSDGASVIGFLRVGHTVLINTPTVVPPNTRYTVGALSVTLNEQVETPGLLNGGLTVNAIHVQVNAPGVATADVVISSATSSVANCYPYVS